MLPARSASRLKTRQKGASWKPPRMVRADDASIRVRLPYDMTAADFCRIALSFDGAEEGSHMGAVDFRVGGRIFATLASVTEGFGNLALTPEMQAEFVTEAPDLFVPVAGGWGRMGATHIRL